jgi:hypothetical protein
LRGPAAREHDLADHERVVAELGDKAFAGGRLCVERHRRALMLVGAPAETGSVISRLLRLISILCVALVVMSFAMFARDQAAGASEHQQTELVAGANTSVAPVAITHRHSQPRRFIDGAAKALTSPFSAVVKSNNPWVDNGLPAVFALLVYGVGLGYLARFASVRVHSLSS